MRDRLAAAVVVTVCAVLAGVMVDLTFAASLSETDRAASLGAIAAIGLVLAKGIADYLDGDDRDDRDDGDDGS